MVNGMDGRDARATEKKLENMLAENWWRDYSEMSGFVQARISLLLVRSNTLLLSRQSGNQVLMGGRPIWECGARVSLAGIFST